MVDPGGQGPCAGAGRHAGPAAALARRPAVAASQVGGHVAKDASECPGRMCVLPCMLQLDR